MNKIFSDADYRMFQIVSSSDISYAYFLVTKRDEDQYISLTIDKHNISETEYIFSYEEALNYITDTLIRILPVYYVPFEPPLSFYNCGYIQDVKWNKPIDFNITDENIEYLFTLNKASVEVAVKSRRGSAVTRFGNGIVMYNGLNIGPDKAVAFAYSFKLNKYAVIFHPNIINLGYRYIVK